MVKKITNELPAWLDERDRGYIEAMEDAVEREAASCAVTTYRRPDRLKHGDPIPTLALARLENGGKTNLSTLRGRPLILLFGSYTWPPFRRQSGDLQQLYEDFRERAEFFVVYIAEAHPVDGWQMLSNEQEGIRIQQPVTFEARLAAAQRCADSLTLTIPVLVDGLDNAAMERFSAWPERIYIADRRGRIHYIGGQGPYDFKPEEARASLVALLEAEEVANVDCRPLPESGM
jgi:hypothetical protein